MAMPVSMRTETPPRRSGPLTVADLAEQLQNVAEEQARVQAALMRIAGLLPLATAPHVAGSGERTAYLTVADAAKLLKVDRTTIYAWIDQKGLPFQYIGTRRRIKGEALDAWLAEQTDGPRR
jgi:excisionase family DNA binding protein